MKKGLIFISLAILLLTPWPVVYAHENTLSGEMMQVEVTAAETSASPSCNVFGGAIGGITPGDLFYLDSKGSMDTLVTLHLTNADELIHSYRYMILRVGVYVQVGENQWGWATLSNGDPVPDTCLTMRNGRVSFRLPGYDSYKITLDGGSFYSFSTVADGGGAASPNFYLTVD